MRWPLLLLVAFVLLPIVSQAQQIALIEADGTVWAREQTIKGTLSGATEATLFINDEPIGFSAPSGTFAVDVVLGAGENEIIACAGSVCTDPLRLTLGFVLRPDVLAWATVSGLSVTLHTEIVEHPNGGPLMYHWQADPANPSVVTLAGTSQAQATASIPGSAPDGAYYFDVTVEDTTGATFTARTFVVKDGNTLDPFDIVTEHAPWVDRAVIYEIAPRLFSYEGGSVNNGRLRYITQRLPELERLGINTIWIQPIHPNVGGGQAYDVTDYFEVWDRLGTKEDLRTLVDAAHARGMKVMLDFVPNHSSVHHPYAQDAIANGPASQYYDFYMRQPDNAPYSRHYVTHTQGQMQFVSYFAWDDFANFNFDSPEAQRFIIEASRYWVEEFDIDGYRFDVVWGPHTRNPEFTQAWRQALKRVKPEVLLLAEAKATYSAAYAGTGHPSEFAFGDLAYDWTESSSCVSQWAFARDCNYFAYNDDPKRTIFNFGNARFRARDLQWALTNRGKGFPDDAYILRYLENNDLPRFVANHSVAQTKMAATLMFALPGVPMLYYGQEAGATNAYPSYPMHSTIASFDDDGLFPFYQHLIRVRLAFPALRSRTWEELDVAPDNVDDYTFAFLREGKDGDVPVIGVLNMEANDAIATLTLPTGDLGLNPQQTYYLTDLFTGEPISATGEELQALTISVPGHTTRLFALADEVVAIPSANQEWPSVPQVISLEPNYPNPFSGSTTIRYTLGRPATVKITVYDLLGRTVADLSPATTRQAGMHQVPFDATGLAGGVYLVRLEAAGETHVQKVIHVR